MEIYKNFQQFQEMDTRTPIPRMTQEFSFYDAIFMEYWMTFFPREYGYLRPVLALKLSLEKLISEILGIDAVFSENEGFSEPFAEPTGCIRSSDDLS